MSTARAEKFVLRPYRSSDLDRLCEIDRLCFPELIAYPAQEMQEMLNAKGAVTIVAETSQGVVAGFGIAVEEGDGAGHVVTLDVVPEFRHLGLGSQLMATMEQRLSEAGAARVRLETAEANRDAQRLFEKLGYRRIRKAGNYYPDGTDAVVMEKGLA